MQQNLKTWTRAQVVDAFRRLADAIEADHFPPESLDALRWLGRTFGNGTRYIDVGSVSVLLRDHAYPRNSRS